MAVWRGVYVNGGTFEMSGGEISGNEASSGGGVSVLGGTFEMSGGKISGNTDGGVYVFDGTFEMSGGEISGNSASDGGGVLVASSGTFEMSGGEISGNKANFGGGVYVPSGTFEMSGGTISGNSVTDRGGGVFVANSTFTKGINGTIYGSNAGGTLKNTVAAGDAYGHAVYMNSNGKKRNTTAGVGVTLNSGTNSNWEK